MKKFKKSINSFLSCLLLTGILFTVSASAEKETKIDCGINCVCTIDADGNATVKKSSSFDLRSPVIDDNALSGNKDIKKLTVTEGITSLGTGAFGFCTSLKEISLPSTLTAIGKKAFAGSCNVERISVSQDNCVYNSSDGCNAIMRTDDDTLIFGCKTTVIPENTAVIASNAFYRISGLTQINIPKNVKSIFVDSFFECSDLSKITVDELNPCYDSRDGSNSIIATSTDTLIKGSDSTVIPSSVSRIAVNAFRSCNKLESIVIPDDVSFIGENAFYGCTGLKEIILPKKTDTLGAYTFKNCSSLESITLQEGFEKICSGAFEGCTALKKIEIPSSVSCIEDYSFINCISLEKIKVSAENTVYNSDGDCNAVIQTSSGSLLLGCKNTVITSDIKEIASYAFYRCVGLEKAVIPYGVTKIGTAAFAFCRNLTEVSIPSSVKTLNGYTFYNCPKLDEITVSAGLTEIGSLDFGCCVSLNEIVLPEGLTKIARYAFSDCLFLNKVDLPSTIKSVEKDAFASTCVKTLTVRSKTVDLTNSRLCYGYDESVYDKIADICTEYYELKCLVNEDGELLISDKTSEYESLADEMDSAVAGKKLTVSDEAKISGFRDARSQRYADERKIKFEWCTLSGEHTGIEARDYQPTCTEYGFIGGSACVDCDTVFSIPTRIDPLGHESTYAAASSPTCTQAGCTAGTKCNRCGTILTGCETIEPTGHTDKNDDGICDVCSADTGEQVNAWKKIIRFLRGVIDKLLQLFKKLFGGG